MGPWKKLLGLAFDAYWADPENDACPPTDFGKWRVFLLEYQILDQEGHRPVLFYLRVRLDQASIWSQGDYRDDNTAILFKSLSALNPELSKYRLSPNTQYQGLFAWVIDRHEGNQHDLSIERYEGSPVAYVYRFSGVDTVCFVGLAREPRTTWSTVRIPEDQVQVDYARAVRPGGAMPLRHLTEWLVFSLNFNVLTAEGPETIMAAARVRRDACEATAIGSDSEDKRSWHARCTLVLHAISAIVRSGIIPLAHVVSVDWHDPTADLTTREILLTQEGEAYIKVGDYSITGTSLANEPDGIRVEAPENPEIEVARQVGEEVCSLLFNRYENKFKQPHYEASEVLGKQQYLITVIRGAGVMYPKFTVQVACGEASASFNWQSGLGNDLIGSCELEFHLPTSGSGDELRRTMNNVEAIGVLESRWLAVLMKHLRKVEMSHLEPQARIN